MRLKHIPIFLCVFLISACAETQFAAHVAKNLPGEQPKQQEGNFKVGTPYKVDGQWYTPQETYKFTETGIASWYGPGFNGKRTANGEKFDKNELTAAHRTLQMPSLVRVTNLENGRSLVVRVNDRGPFKRGRVMDVSERAAELLGFKGKGTAKVRLDLLADESKAMAMAARRGEQTEGMEVAMNDPRHPAPMTGFQPASYQPPGAIQSEQLAPAVPSHLRDGEIFPDPVVSQFPVMPSNIYVQTGSFSDKANADRLASNLRSTGQVQVVPAFVKGRQFYRVRLGPVSSVEKADSLLSQLVSTGNKESIIVVE